MKWENYIKARKVGGKVLWECEWSEKRILRLVKGDKSIKNEYVSEVGKIILN